LTALQRIAPRKSTGFPFGHELRIVRNYLRGRNNLFDPSILSGVYRRLLSPDARTLYDAFVAGRPLAEAQWRGILGDRVAGWRDRGLLSAVSHRKWRCVFRVAPLDDRLLLTDPFDLSTRWRVHLGQDSINMASFVARRSCPANSALDVGTGTGVQLLSFRQAIATGLGVDINPRAVRMARLNLAINGLSHWNVEERDVFAPNWNPEPFDLVTWNLPFLFYPAEAGAENLASQGGHLGIALTLNFVERLPSLLAANGVAYLMTSAPIMFDGENRLESELAALAQRYSLDLETHVLQVRWDPSLEAFHASCRIEYFESVMVAARHGQGRLVRHAPHRLQRTTDWLRQRLRSFHRHRGPQLVRSRR
jgi:hypothetical protein